MHRADVYEAAGRLDEAERLREMRRSLIDELYFNPRTPEKYRKKDEGEAGP